PLVRRVGIRKQLANVTQCGCTKQCVRDGVTYGVSIGVPHESRVARNLHAAKQHWAARGEPVRVVPDSGAYHTRQATGGSPRAACNRLQEQAGIMRLTMLRSLREATDGEYRVMPAEARTVRECGTNLTLTRLVGGIVQIAILPRLEVIDGRRNYTIANCHHADQELNRAGRTKHVPGGRLCGRDAQPVCMLTEYRSNRERLVRVVERRGRSMRVDVVNFAQRQTGIADSATHCPLQTFVRLRPTGEMIGISGCAVAHQLRMDGCTTRTRMLQFLQYHQTRTLSHHEAIPILVERA